MRSLLRRSRTVFKQRSLGSPSVLAHCSRRSLHSSLALRGRNPGGHVRGLSSAANPPPTPEADHYEEAEKRKSRGRTRRSPEKMESASLPPDLDILWHQDVARSPETSALPPPEMFQEILHNFLITLHPQTQHRATYSFHNGSPVEPTLALYCPIEGGDYVINETVRELARRTHSEVIMLDGIEIAAGEWGAFGKAATAIQLPANPLHFSSASSSNFPPSSSSPSSSMEPEDDIEESGTPHIIVSASQPFAFPQLGAPVNRQPRSNVLVSRRTSPSKAKAFFDEILNMPSSITGDTSKDGISSPLPRPRIIYIRDYPTLAPSLSSWFPSLVASVRAYRQGAIARPTSPITSPVTIVFGITPSIVLPTTSSSPGSPAGLLRFLINRGSSAVVRRDDGVKSPDAWDESPHADKARERRLKERLRSWGNGDPSFRDELPEFSLSPSDGEQSGPGTGLIIAAPRGSSFSSGIITARQSDSRSGDENRSYFRLSVVVPSVRSPMQEKECRIARRRQLNELIVRMAVGDVGGVLLGRFDAPAQTSAFEVTQPADSAQYLPKGTQDDPELAAGASLEGAISASSNAAASDMWRDWGQRVEIWTTAKEIADRAVGSVVASLSDKTSKKLFVTGGLLDPTPIPWSAVYEAWKSQRDARRSRDAWIEQSTGQATDEDERTESTGRDGAKTDEVIERIKRDPDLDEYETRLLGCIVDPASMSTTFNQVHLPAHTIDSVRTLVSLPLLHPQAFTQGVLKQHTMTGALLFGPPGTGKTLVVRALAKESGARMLIIKPSDVMDMYVGEGEKLVRSVFSLARRLSPCVVFLDELDALFGARVSTRETGGALAHRGILTEFMQEMDGLKTSRDSNVIVIGATNRPFDLDDAVLRRLPRRLLVDLPGEREREEILKILLRDELLAPEVDFKYLARRTESFSGSDLKHLCVSAALDAVKEKVKLPWNVPRTTTSSEDKSSMEVGSTVDDPVGVTPDAKRSFVLIGTQVPPTTRVLSLRNFHKAMAEITPSASESLGTLSELRKWNEEFGEGGKQRKKRMWGGRFGFTDNVPGHVNGKVGSSSPFA